MYKLYHDSLRIYQGSANMVGGREGGYGGRGRERERGGWKEEKMEASQTPPLRDTRIEARLPPSESLSSANASY